MGEITDDAVSVETNPGSIELDGGPNVGRKAGASEIALPDVVCAVSVG